MGFLGGKFLVQGFRWILLEALGILGVLVFAPIRSSNLEYPPVPSSAGVSTQCVTRSPERLLCQNFGTAANSSNINKKYLFILRTFV